MLQLSGPQCREENRITSLLTTPQTHAAPPALSIGAQTTEQPDLCSSTLNPGLEEQTQQIEKQKERIKAHQCNGLNFGVEFFGPISLRDFLPRSPQRCDDR